MTVDENYFTEKYGLTRTHSEVLLSADIVKPGKRSISVAEMAVTASTSLPTAMT